MKDVTLGHTKENVSELCLGTMMFGTAMDKKTSFAVLDHFYEEAGGNFIDTANCYAWWVGRGEYVGNESETILGEWMHERKNRKNLFVATKVGARLKNPKSIRDKEGNIEWERVPAEYEGLSKSIIIREVDQSLLRLKTDYIDLYYTHVNDNSVPIEETMDALNTLIQQGKVRYIGASNLTTEQLCTANEVAKNQLMTPYSVLQMEYSYLHPVNNSEGSNHIGKKMFDYINSENMAFCAYSPLLKGIYTNADKKYLYYNWHQYDSPESLNKLALVDDLAQQLNITGNQLVLAWMLRKTPGIIPILGFSKWEHYIENIKTCEISIPDEIVMQLNQKEN